MEALALNDLARYFKVTPSALCLEASVHPAVATYSKNGSRGISQESAYRIAKEWNCEAIICKDGIRFRPPVEELKDALQ